MKIVAFDAPSNARTVSRLVGGLFGLAAAAWLLAACQGGASTPNRAYWQDMFGDPDTGHKPCCRHAGRDSDH